MIRNPDTRTLLSAAILAISANISGAYAQNQKLSIVSLDYPPFIYEDNGKVVGLVVDAEKEAFAKAGYDVDFRILPWARALQEAKEGTADVVAAAGRSPEREQFLDFTKEPIYSSEFVWFVKRDRSIAYTGDLAEMKDAVIGAVNNVSYGNIFNDAVKAGRFPKIEYVNSYSLNIGKLLAGRIDVMVANRLVAMAELKKANALDQVKMLSPSIGSDDVTTGFSKAKSLGEARAAFEKQLTSMKQDGRYQAIYDRYSK